MVEDAGIAGIYRKMRRRLGVAVRSLVGASEVEDILQEAFLRCYEAEGKRPVEHPSAYLMRTAVNLAINHATRAEQRLNSPLDHVLGDAEPVSDLDIETQAIQRERLALYCRAVAELPLQCRRAFLLKKVYGLSQREIAAYLGISENTVEKHIAKGLLHCATRIRESEADATPRPVASRARRHG
jgi:RNA polymerase sigma factor (sigma-70 family)